MIRRDHVRPASLAPSGNRHALGHAEPRGACAVALGPKAEAEQIKAELAVFLRETSPWS
jgi:hypothetical protein